MATIGEPEEVLVVVKASPQPSKQYGDTVCVAGISIAEPHRWLRLYPVPFRYLEDDKKFSKYDVVTDTMCGLVRGVSAGLERARAILAEEHILRLSRSDVAAVEDGLDREPDVIHELRNLLNRIEQR